MPFVSQAQNRWAHTKTGTSALGGPSAVKEWAGATDFSGLPEKVGALTQAARLANKTRLSNKKSDKIG